MDADHLQVLPVGIGHLKVARHDLPLYPIQLEQIIAGDAVHAVHQFVETVRNDEILASLLERLDRPRRTTADGAAGCQPPVAASQIGILF